MLKYPLLGRGRVPNPGGGRGGGGGQQGGPGRGGAVKRK